jgi:hypothetical protein
VALTYSRRGVYILSSFRDSSALASFWLAYSTSKGEYYAYRIILGIFVSPVDSLPVSIFRPKMSPCSIFTGSHCSRSFFCSRARSFYEYLLFLAVWLKCSRSASFPPFTKKSLANLKRFFTGWINVTVEWKWVMWFGALVQAFANIILYFFMEEAM